MADLSIFFVGLVITLMVSGAFVLLMYGAADKPLPWESGTQKDRRAVSGDRDDAPDSPSGPAHERSATP